MVTIINGFRRPNPIADGIRNAAQALFGDRLTPALKQSQLNLAEQKFARENAEAIGLDRLAGSFDTGDASGRLGNAVRSGFSASDLGRLGLQEAAQGFDGNLSGPGALGLGRAQFGAGLATGSTIPGFNASEAQDATLTREGIASRASSARTAASIAAQQRANAAANLLAQRAQEFNRTPVESVVGGQPVFTPQSDVFNPGVSPVQTLTEAQGGLLNRNAANLSPLELRAAIGAAPSQSEVQGSLLGQNFDDLGGLGPRQAAVLGALPSATEVDAIAAQQVLDAGGFDPASVSPAAAATGFGFGEPTPATPLPVTRFQSRDGTQFFTSVDNGLTDSVTGQPIPQDAIRVGPVSPTSIGDAGGLQPTSTNASAVFNEAAALRNFQDLTGIARDVAASDPTIFGLAGRARSLGQGITNAAQSIDALLGGDGALAARVTDAQRAVLDESTDPNVRASLAGLFDPNLDAISRLSTLLVFQGASALAGQEGRGLSDKDVKLFEGVFGDPKGLFASQETFLNALDLADRIVSRRLQANTERQGGQFNPAPTAAVPEITIDVDGNIVQ